MVRPERFELPTYCSGGNRSIQLSYGRTMAGIIISIAAAAAGTLLDPTIAIDELLRGPEGSIVQFFETLDHPEALAKLAM